MYFSSQPWLGESVSATNSRPRSSRISLQSGLIRYTTSELAVTNARNRSSLSRSASSARFREVMSRVTPMRPVTFPEASRTGDFVVRNQRLPLGLSTRSSNVIASPAAMTFRSFSTIVAPVSSSSKNSRSLRPSTSCAGFPIASSVAVLANSIRLCSSLTKTGSGMLSASMRNSPELWRSASARSRRASTARLCS